jgi:hypothetical protein
MQKRHSGSRFGATAVAGVMLLGITLLGFTGCEDEPSSSGENRITAFKIGDTLGAIDEEAQKISITLPAGASLTALKPVVTVSSNASVSPESETEVNIAHPYPIRLPRRTELPGRTR